MRLTVSHVNKYFWELQVTFWHHIVALVNTQSTEKVWDKNGANCSQRVRRVIAVCSQKGLSCSFLLHSVFCSVLDQVETKLLVDDGKKRSFRKLFRFHCFEICRTLYVQKTRIPIKFLESWEYFLTSDSNKLMVTKLTKCVENAKFEWTAETIPSSRLKHWFRRFLCNEIECWLQLGSAEWYPDWKLSCNAQTERISKLSSILKHGIRSSQNFDVLFSFNRASLAIRQHGKRQSLFVFCTVSATRILPLPIPTPIRPVRPWLRRTPEKDLLSFLRFRWEIRLGEPQTHEVTRAWCWCDWCAKASLPKSSVLITQREDNLNCMMQFITPNRPFDKKGRHSAGPNSIFSGRADTHCHGVYSDLRFHAWHWTLE